MTKLFRKRKKYVEFDNCKHQYMEVGRRVVNGAEAFNGHSSEYNVEYKCVKCGKTHHKWELGRW